MPLRKLSYGVKMNPLFGNRGKKQVEDFNAYELCRGDAYLQPIFDTYKRVRWTVHGGKQLDKLSLIQAEMKRIEVLADANSPTRCLFIRLDKQYYIMAEGNYEFDLYPVYDHEQMLDKFCDVAKGEGMLDKRAGRAWIKGYVEGQLARRSSSPKPSPGFALDL